MAYISFKPTDYFISKSWDTSAATSQTVTTGMQPDMIWADDLRGTRSSVLYDTVRGLTKQLDLSSSNVQTTTTGITSVSATGFVTGVNDFTNPNHGAASNPNMDGYSWKMGTTSVPSGGSITPTAVSINTTTKQGIYRYVGTGSAATIAHGLGNAPDFMIVRKLDDGNNWESYHKSNGATKNMVFSETDSVVTSSTCWNSTEPSSTLISLGTNVGVNQGSQPYICYAFCNVPGYAHCSTYRGNGLVDGPFMFTGFKPAWVLLKKVTGTGGWYIRNISQSASGTTPYIGNVGGSTSGYGKLQYVYANADGGTTTSNAITDDIISFTSNGFKVTCTASGNNTNAQDYIYVAFAEYPIIGSNGTTGVAL